MEGRLGADFDGVRVHTGSAAHESAKEIGARACTVGDNVVFRRGSCDPTSHQGRTTLARELTHVIQHRSGPVYGTQAPGGIRHRSSSVPPTPRPAASPATGRRLSRRIRPRVEASLSKDASSWVMRRSVAAAVLPTTCGSTPAIEQDNPPAIVRRCH
ncbi:DUF4157 domain-containing protein [Streptomyces sp. NK08204]|uniref:eCIS core domain-containing protein n=1 Tax=Streptomyces sp. NK08204 TaxID=2873260 RepID=UPI0021F2100B|nr:DUF4157 domain-containing protein [Streptomyces sp. NK08204]